MLGHRSSTWLTRAVLGCAWAVAPLACAHSIETTLDFRVETGADSGAAGMPVTIGTGGMAGSGGPTGGGIGTSSTTGGSAGTTTVGSGGTSGGSAGNMGSTGGAAGSNAGNGGSGGAGGTAGTGGAGGKAGNGGAGGAGGASGAAGTAGMGGAGGSMQRPTGVTLAAATTPSGQQLTVTNTGTLFTEKCAQNEVIIGYKGTMQPAGSVMNWLQSFQAVCATLSVTGTTTYTVNTTQAQILAVHGMAQSVMVSAMCAANQIIVGFGSRTGGAVDQFTFMCAPLVIGGTSPNFTLSIGAITTLPAMGGPGGSANGTISCPAGLVAVGDEGREGGAIEAFGLLCSRPTLVVQ